MATKAEGIAAHIQGLREAKAAFNALPQIVRENMLAATETTVREIARGAQARLESSPSIRTRALYNHVAWKVTPTNGRGRVGIATGTTTSVVAGVKVRVKGIQTEAVARDSADAVRAPGRTRHAAYARGTLHAAGGGSAETALPGALQGRREGHREGCRGDWAGTHL
jgi:phage terminase small subunit